MPGSTGWPMRVGSFSTAVNLCSWTNLQPEIVNDSKPNCHAASAARQVEDIPAAPCRGLFPLTPALSLGERVNASLRRAQSRYLCVLPREARCSLSLRERVTVRGNGAKYPLAHRTIPGTVELDEPS